MWEHQRDRAFNELMSFITPEDVHGFIFVHIDFSFAEMFCGL